jgi:hypothetical protein
VLHWKLQAVTIGEGENRHKCIGGHQYRGMAGYSLKGSKWASVRTCNDIKDTDLLEIEGKQTTWSDFKSQTTSWDFSLDTNLAQDKLTDNQAQMAALWKCIGKTLCTEYLYSKLHLY